MDDLITRVPPAVNPAVNRVEPEHNRPNPDRDKRNPEKRDRKPGEAEDGGQPVAPPAPGIHKMDIRV